MSIELFALLIILAAGLYMAWNIGANDVANAIGTSIGSGALTLRQAVLLAAVFEFAGAFFFGSHVSRTVEEGIVITSLFQHDPMIIVWGMLSCLIGAGVWLQIASYFGWPVSTTHAIVGAVVGFGLAAGGLEAIYWDQVVYIGAVWVLSPLVGGVLAYFVFSFILKKIFYSRHPLKSSKAVLPPLVFVFLMIVTLIIGYEGTRHLSLTLSLPTVFICSLLIALIGAALCYRSILAIEPEKPEPSSTLYNPEIIEDLTKAKKALQRARKVALGEQHAQVSYLMNQVDELSYNVNESIQLRKARPDIQAVEKIFARLQWISTCLMAFAHGANDVANAIGPLTAAVTVLLTGSIVIDNTVPLWALALGGGGILLGLMTWGWRVIETIGKKITELTPSRGFSAEFGAALTILIASRLGFPLSATHTLVGAVLGVGFARGIEALNLRTMRNIIMSWLITLPAGALLGIGIFSAIRAITGQ